VTIILPGVMNIPRILPAIVLGIALAFTSLAAPPAKTDKRSAGARDVSAAQVNGTWEYRANTFKVWALGGQKLQIEFAGVHEYKSPAGPMANTGEGSGIATIEGDTAIFRPEGADEKCRIVLKFKDGKLIVKQDGDCGFGAGVAADGTYRKVSDRKPKFGE
jgi:hypothetical protein